MDWLWLLANRNLNLNPTDFKHKTRIQWIRILAGFVMSLLIIRVRCLLQACLCISISVLNHTSDVVATGNGILTEGASDARNSRSAARVHPFHVPLLFFPFFSPYTLFSPFSLPSVLWRCWLGGRKGIQPVKNWVVRCYHGYLFGARCRFAYRPADATATHYLLLQ